MMRSKESSVLPQGCCGHPKNSGHICGFRTRGCLERRCDTSNKKTEDIRRQSRNSSNTPKPGSGQSPRILNKLFLARCRGSWVRLGLRYRWSTSTQICSRTHSERNAVNPLPRVACMLIGAGLGYSQLCRGFLHTA